MPSGYTDATVTSGTTITSAWGNLIRDSVVSVFASSAARDSAITSPANGMFCYITGSDRLEVYDGTGWLILDEPWQDYSGSQAFTNVTVGNGTLATRYRRQGLVCHYWGSLVFGSTTSVSGYFTVVPPFASATGTQVGTARLYDNGTRTYVGIMIVNGSSWTFAHTESGSNGLVDATNPFTWTTSDEIQWTISYPISAANAYD